MTSAIDIVPLTRKSHDVLRFLEVSYGIYRDDPLWVAPLLMDLKKVFTDENPLFGHAEMALWVAVKNGQDVGRIAGILDRNHNHTQNDSAAFFGFFESVNDAEVSRRLFDTVFTWARQQGVKRLLGPMNPTTNDECGLLVEGFDSSPVFMMTYNPRYYLDFMAAAGFRKSKDLLAYHVDVAKAPLDRLDRVAEKVRRRNPELTFTPIRKATLTRDLAKVKEVYNAAWEANWGFVPMTDAEVDFMASRLKPLLLEGLIWVAETATEPVAFMLALPDYNIALKPLNGRLGTPKLLGFVPYLLGWKHPAWCRVVTLGVKEKYRNRGLETVMLMEGFRTGIKVGFTDAEASWILEDNVAMCRLMEVFNGKVYKRYRIYEREVP
ncbi:MAG TPA: N-acetyltransferase [Verrucomicrobiae bacterium]|nr:N-acetyltransferase [Verrucomicrobiae bacterium]